MGMIQKAGFTILETMLFLAITGVLIIALLTGVGTSIATQRYRDSVQSLKALIQDQYTQLTSVVNDRSKDQDYTCNSNAVVSQVAPGAGQYPGQSNCVLLGRYIVITQGNVYTQDVVGNEASTTTSTGSDIALLKANYKLSLAASDAQTSTLEWAAQITWPIAGTGAQAAGTPRSIGILLIRSPDSGTSYTFTMDSPPAIDQTTSDDLMAMLITGNNVSQPYNGGTLRGQDQRTICVGSDGLIKNGGIAVVLDANATNTTSVETQSNDLLLQNNTGEGTQC